jgi:hypothetical protein
LRKTADGFWITFASASIKTKNMLIRNRNVALLILWITLLAAGCSGNDDQEVVCSDEFKMIGVAVIGGKLDDFYTLRTVTADTIRFTASGQYPLNWYPILDDSYQPLLEGTREDFIFVGIKNATEVVRQQYSIGADVCHIIKYSGPAEVSY